MYPGSRRSRPRPLGFGRSPVWPLRRRTQRSRAPAPPKYRNPASPATIAIPTATCHASEKSADHTTTHPPTAAAPSRLTIWAVTAAAVARTPDIPLRRASTATPASARILPGTYLPRFATRSIAAPSVTPTPRSPNSTRFRDHSAAARPNVTKSSTTERTRNGTSSRTSVQSTVPTSPNLTPAPRRISHVTTTVSTSLTSGTHHRFRAAGTAFTPSPGDSRPFITTFARASANRAGRARTTMRTGGA